LETRLSRALIAGEIRDGSVVHVTAVDQELRLDINQTVEAEIVA
jgi:hypothetical protein